MRSIDMGFEMTDYLSLKGLHLAFVAIVQRADRKESVREGGSDWKGPRARTQTRQKRNHAMCQSAAHRLSDMMVPTSLQLLLRSLKMKNFGQC